MYSVHQHWDPLKVCIVGRSYNPQFYDYIKDKKIRKVFYKIAEETEEDFQNLISLLHSFGVETLRPEVSDNYLDYIQNDIILPPPMTPRDYTAMVSNNFYIDRRDLRSNWDKIKGDSWPDKPDNFSDIPSWILDETRDIFNIWAREDFAFDNIVKYMEKNSNIIYDQNVNSANTLRLGKDLFFGTDSYDDPVDLLLEKYKRLFPDYRCHIMNTGGHADGIYCAVSPGLIISSREITDYTNLFPGWEVVYAESASVDLIPDFDKIKEKNDGKWWIPGAESDIDLINYIETCVSNWIGYVQETVFDVNILIVDKNNVICNSYNQQIFDALVKRNITPHVLNFRHKYFWDGGVHCLTSDVHRLGNLQDCFINNH